jgi:hypothetical protein
MMMIASSVIFTLTKLRHILVCAFHNEIHRKFKDSYRQRTEETTGSNNTGSLEFLLVPKVLRNGFCSFV